MRRILSALASASVIAGTLFTAPALAAGSGVRVLMPQPGTELSF